jgi:NTP pyrophosphatase (non-canonical NTP hydrolase)
MSSMTLKEIIEKQKNFDKRYTGKISFFEEINEENIEVLEHLLVCLYGEIGEVSNIVKKVVRGDFSLESKREAIEEELADVFIYLIKIAGQLDVDLESNFIKKMSKNKEKFERYKKK